MLLEIRFKNHIKKRVGKCRLWWLNASDVAWYAWSYAFIITFPKLVFCLYAVFVFSVCSKFDVIFINFCNICIIIIYIAGVRYSVFLFWLITSNLNNLWEQIHVIKTIVYKKTDNWYIEWRVTANDNEWQRVTTNGNEWQVVRVVVQRIKAAHYTSKNGWLPSF